MPGLPRDSEGSTLLATRELQTRMSTPLAPRLPALLCDGTYYGSLAAVRSLGRGGIPVVVADDKRMTPASWSRYATRVMRCPPVSDADAMLRWLLRFGAREERTVLYPTSDEMAFLLSRHRAALDEHFALYQPDLGTILRVLDKRLLLEAAREAGVDTPATFFPATRAEAERCAREAPGPLLVKPRTQLFLELHRKGALAYGSPEDVGEAFDLFRRRNRYLPPIADQHPELTQPMLQRYYPEATESIHSVSGFRSRDGRHLAMLGAVKLLQRPRRLGVGLCFESAEVPEAVRTATTRLLEVLGYYGVFELEFIQAGGRHLLIDMNPRFYNQLQLDVSRGLDLPRMAYAGAVEDELELAALVARTSQSVGPQAFCNGIGLRMLVGAQLAFGTMSTADATRWRDWQRKHGPSLVDSLAADDDIAPFVAEGASQVYGCLRHPRAFLRMIALDR